MSSLCINKSLLLLIVINLGLIQACRHVPEPKKEIPPPVIKPVTPVVTKPKEPPMSMAVRLLILNGEYTLAHDQLLTPVNDNAFDYFRAALKLDPNNQRAKGGLQGIVMRYVDLARQAAARANYSTALTMLNNARLVDPENLLIKEVSAALSEQLKSAPPVASYKGGHNEFLLDTRELSDNNPQAQSRFAEIVNKLKETNSLALIIARTDNEGRWIYQQLREVDPNYRVRGDIKLGSPPRVIMEPIAQPKAQPIEQSSVETIPQPVEEQLQRPLEQSAEQPAEQSKEKETEKPTEELVKNHVEELVKSSEPSAKSTEQSVANPAEIPIESTKEIPSAPSVEQLTKQTEVKSENNQ